MRPKLANLLPAIINAWQDWRRKTPPCPEQCVEFEHMMENDYGVKLNVVQVSAGNHHIKTASIVNDQKCLVLLLRWA